MDRRNRDSPRIRSVSNRHDNIRQARDRPGMARRRDGGGDHLRTRCPGSLRRRPGRHTGEAPSRSGSDGNRSTVKGGGVNVDTIPLCRTISAAGSAASFHVPTGPGHGCNPRRENLPSQLRRVPQIQEEVIFTMPSLGCCSSGSGTFSAAILNGAW